MSDNFPFTRRQFVQSGLVMLSAAAGVPLFVQHSAQALAAPEGTSLGNRPGVPDERILVIVQLSGGNDGLNTVIPYGMPEYYRARPMLNVKEADALVLDKGRGLALHEGMADLKAMVDEGTAAILQGVGYPNPNRSHFASMDIWHTADTRGGRGYGWVGKTMDQLKAGRGTDLDATACVCIGREAPLAAEGKTVKPVAFENANLFRWTGGDLHPALAQSYDTINRAGLRDDDGSQAAFVTRTALDAQIATDRIRAAVAQQPLTAFPGGRLANELKMVAAMIRAGLPTRVYYTSIGGFDTHANQAPTHTRILREFSSAVRAFYAELKAMRQEQRVLTLAFSEFGRRVQQNASAGTDHGTAGPMFLFGHMVRPGLHGEHPSLADLDNGDLVYHTDFRSVYAAVLEQWMKVKSEAVLGKAFKPAAVLA